MSSKVVHVLQNRITSIDTIHVSKAPEGGNRFLEGGSRVLQVDGHFRNVLKERRDDGSEQAL